MRRLFFLPLLFLLLFGPAEAQIPNGSEYFHRFEDGYELPKPVPLSFEPTSTNLADESPSSMNRLLSLHQYRRGELDLAINHLRKESVRFTRSTHLAESQLLQALEVLSLYEEHSIAQAITIFSKLEASKLSAEPNMLAEYYFWYAESLHALERNREALNYYDSVIGIIQKTYLYYDAQYRKAEVEEEILLTRESLRDFKALNQVQSPNEFSLLAELRAASLLRSLGEYAELERRLPIIKQYIDKLPVGGISLRGEYQSFIAAVTLDPSQRSERVLGSNTNEFASFDSILYPRYSRLFYYVLASSAYSGLGKFDSTVVVLSEADKLISDEQYMSADASLARALRHLIEFERGWAALSKNDNLNAAALFGKLSEDDSLTHVGNQYSRQLRGVTGTFYHDANTKITASGDSASATMVYDDIPRRAKFYQGIALFRAGKIQQSKDILTELSQDETAIYSDKARYHLALAEFSAQEFIRAQALLEPIAKRRSQTGVYAAILLGDIQYRRQSYAKAADYFSFALANLSPLDTTLVAVSSLERGLSLIPLNGWSESMSDLRRFVGLSNPSTPGLDEGLFWLGRMYLKTDSIAAAKAIFERFLSEFPKTDRRIDAEYGYAWALFRGGDYVKADKSFAKVMAMDSITRYAYDALSRRGDAAYAAGNILQASKIYNLAVDRPTFDEYRTARSMFQLGILRMRADSARSAISAFSYVINKLQKSDLVEGSYYNLAAAAFAIKLNDKANDAVATLTKKYPQSVFAPRSLFLQAGERERTGDAKGAYQSYRKIISTYPASAEFRPALFGAVDALVEMDRNVDAINLADSFYNKYSSAPFASSLLYRKGEIEFEADRFKDSRKTFDRFTDVYESDTLYANARVMIAKSIIGSGGSRIEAKQLLSDITERYSENDAASAAYLELARLAKKDEPEKAPTYYTKAFDMQYYSADAAPVAMLEYGKYWKESNTDSARVIFEDLTKRYLIETSVGAKAQLEVVNIWLVQGNKVSAMAKLDRVVAAHRGDAIGTQSALQLADLYYHSGAFKKSLELFNDVTETEVTNDQLASAYIGAARSEIKLSQNKQAIASLRKALSLRGVSGTNREHAQQLLQSLLPKKGKKR